MAQKIERIFLALAVLLVLAQFGVVLADGEEILDPPIPWPEGDPPATPNNLSAVFIGQNQIDADWSDNSEEDFSHYEVFLNDSMIGTTTISYYTFNGLTNDNAYSIQVKAVDFEGLKSEPASINERTEASYVAPPQPRPETPSTPSGGGGTPAQPEQETVEETAQEQPAVEPAQEQTVPSAPIAEEALAEEQPAAEVPAPASNNITGQVALSNNATGFFALTTQYLYYLLLIGLIAFISGMYMRIQRKKVVPK